MVVRRPADRLHGHAHGSDEHRAPHLVVPPEQITAHLPGPLPELTPDQATAQGLLTRGEVADLTGLSLNQVRSRVEMGRLAPVATLVRSHATQGRPHLYDPADARSLVPDAHPA